MSALHRALAALFAFGALGALAPRTASHPEVTHSGSAAADNARCEGCHAEIAAEWRGSLHRQAYTDPAYQRALAREPLAFCRGCHAPEANPDHDAPADLGGLGVGCVSCHATPGGALAASRACASCHEFSFPDPERRPRSELMQSTASEHSASPFASVSCAGCHMPTVQDGGGRAHHSHAFPASRDAALVRAAVRVSAVRKAAGEVEVRLSPSGIGHSFPTGDLFRRVEVRAEAVGPEANVAAEDVRYLARRFGKVPGKGGHFIKVMLADTRVSSGEEKVVSLSLGSGASGLPIAWRVAYQRVEHPIEDEKDSAVVGGEIEIAAGVLR